MAKSNRQDAENAKENYPQIPQITQIQ